MSELDTTFHSTSPQLTSAAVLGLTDPHGEDWSRLRGMQFSALGKLTPIRMFVNLVLAVMAVWLLRSAVSPLWLGFWFCAMLLVQARGAAIAARTALTNQLAAAATAFLKGELRRQRDACTRYITRLDADRSHHGSHLPGRPRRTRRLFGQTGRHACRRRAARQ